MSSELPLVLSFEKNKLKRKKGIKVFAIVTLVLVLLICFFSFIIDSTYYDYPEYISGVTIQEQTDTLKSALNWNDLSAYQRQQIEKQIAMNEYFMETGTKQKDYAYFDDENSCGTKYGYGMDQSIGIDSLIKSLSTIFLPLMLLTVIFTLAVFSDANGENIKNVIATSTSRKSFIVGKILYLIINFSIVFAALNLFMLFLVMGQLSFDFLIYKNGAFTVVNCANVLFSRLFGLYIAIIAMSSITAFITIFTRKRALAVVLPVAIYTILYFLNSSTPSVGKFLPFINLQYCPEYGFTGLFAALLIIYLALSAGVGLLFFKIFKRQDL